MAAGHAEGPPDEYQVKAAFLYNFAKFVEWPQEAFQNQSEPLVVCVLGDNPFGRTLDLAARRHHGAGHGGHPAPAGLPS